MEQYLQLCDTSAKMKFSDDQPSPGEAKMNSSDTVVVSWVASRENFCSTLNKLKKKEIKYRQSLEWICTPSFHVTVNRPFFVHAIVCVGLSLIETSLCAQALRVDVSGVLGRAPLSSYPSRERSAAKPNLGFTAFDKPSNGAPGQRAKKRQGGRRQRRKRTRTHTRTAPASARMNASERESVRLKISHRDGISGWSHCAFCLATAAGFKTGIRSIHGILCVNVKQKKTKKKSSSLPRCQYLTSCFLMHTPGSCLPA